MSLIVCSIRIIAFFDFFFNAFQDLVYIIYYLNIILLHDFFKNVQFEFFVTFIKSYRKRERWYFFFLKTAHVHLYIEERRLSASYLSDKVSC